MLRYFVLLIFNYVITIGVVALCVERFHQSPYLAACVGIILTTVTGFIVSKYWIFGEKQESN
jgi:putative flippase GtrA